MLNKEVYINRRKKLKENFRDGLILIMGNNFSPLDCEDNTYPFIQDATFKYYFGMDHNGLIGIIDIDNNEEIIFGNDYTMSDIIWMGKQKFLKELALEVGIEKFIEKEELKKLVRSVKDFPEKGVTFRDITTALKDKRGLEIIIKDFTDRYKNKGIDYVVGADARGFIFGAAIAYNIGAGFVPARKPGKLPAEVESVEYSLEYGKNSIEIHKDAFEKNSKILIVDDLLATGGTAEAMVKLVEKLGAKVYELAFMIELVDLKARDLLKGYEVYTQLKY